MDPTACLRALLRHLAEARTLGKDDPLRAAHIERACEGLADLAGWLDRGGFPPAVLLWIEGNDGGSPLDVFRIGEPPAVARKRIEPVLCRCGQARLGHCSVCPGSPRST